MILQQILNGLINSVKKNNFHRQLSGNLQIMKREAYLNK